MRDLTRAEGSLTNTLAQQQMPLHRAASIAYTGAEVPISEDAPRYRGEKQEKLLTELLELTG